MRETQNNVIVFISNPNRAIHCALNLQRNCLFRIEDLYKLNTSIYLKKYRKINKTNSKNIVHVAYFIKMSIAKKIILCLEWSAYHVSAVYE